MPDNNLFWTATDPGKPSVGKKGLTEFTFLLPTEHIQQIVPLKSRLSQSQFFCVASDKDHLKITMISYFGIPGYKYEVNIYLESTEALDMIGLGK